MTDDEGSRHGGDPSSDSDPAISVRMPAEELAALDDWRRQHADLPSRAEAIRRLVGQALAAAGHPRQLGSGYIKGDELTSENDGGASR